MRRRASEPSPIVSTARTTDACASAEQYTAAARPSNPRTRVPGNARSRAASSALRFEVMPPLVKAPWRCGTPMSWATQAIACSSTSSAPPALEARFTS